VLYYITIYVGRIAKQMNANSNQSPSLFYVTHKTNEPQDLLTQNDLVAAENAYRLWNEYKHANGYGITQTQFAAKLGWTQSTFSQFINGHTPISMAALMKLSAAFNCDPSEIRPEFKNNNLESELYLIKDHLALCLKIMENIDPVKYKIEISRGRTLIQI
jgi:transcriptional regulator with XRE-family HTH domain